jgi:hypothetical protein
MLRHARTVKENFALAKSYGAIIKDECQLAVFDVDQLIIRSAHRAVNAHLRDPFAKSAVVDMNVLIAPLIRAVLLLSKIKGHYFITSQNHFIIKKHFCPYVIQKEYGRFSLRVLQSSCRI